MEHTLIVAGIGPGDPDYILPKAQKAIEEIGRASCRERV